jgi:hypothetical protein
MSKSTTAAIFTQDRWSRELKLPVIRRSDFEIAGASAFMLSPHQQHEKYNTYPHQEHRVLGRESG